MDKEKQYNPIKPKSNFPNPYRTILKSTLENITKEGTKGTMALFNYTAFLSFLPFSGIYYRCKGEDIKKEIAIEQNEEFEQNSKKYDTSSLIGIDDTSSLIGIDIVKTLLYSYGIYLFFN